MFVAAIVCVSETSWSVDALALLTVHTGVRHVVHGATMSLNHEGMKELI